jgi:hypothetical protein
MVDNKGSFGSVRGITADQIYEYDHFAGSQISIYIGDVLVDEINRIEFSVQQTKKPIYGYASQYYDAVASGQVLVTGSFNINFKEAGYMYLVLKRYLDTIGSLEGGEVSPLPQQIAGEENVSVENAKILRRNIERIIADEVTEQKKEAEESGLANPLQATDKFEFYKQLAALPDAEFENMAEVFEDVLWQNSSTQGENLGNIIKSTNLELDQALRRADQFPGFTIWVTYGDINNPIANHTIKKLTGVHIVGSGQVIEISGEPIFEQYQFLARNLL